MMTVAALILYALAATLLVAFILALRSARLQNRFKRLGAVKGRSLDEVIQFAGKPSHRTRMSANREVLEWRRVGFHIALSFTEGVCDGVDYVQD
jgi:hypothetical protein